MDEDGYVWYEGRADDVIIAAGYRIGPFEVESACLEHPAVARGGRGRLARRAARQRRQGVHRARRRATRAPTSWSKEIKAFVRDRLSAYAYPRKIEFVDELPEDADRQDPPHRAAPARANRAAERGAGEATRARALMPQSVARLVGLAALARSARCEWQRLVAGLSSGRALLWVVVAVAAGGGSPRRRARARSLPARGPRLPAVRVLSLLAGYWLSGAGLDMLKPSTGTSCVAGSAAACRRSGPCGCRTSSADPWPRIVLELLGAELLTSPGC